MGAKHFTKQEKDAILQYHKEGYSNTEIAKFTGRSVAGVGRFITLTNNAYALKKAEPAVIKEPMTPREMIKALWDLGYRIEDNELVCYQRQVVKLGDIVNNG